MKKKFIYLAVLVIITISWTYWSSSICLNNISKTILRRHNSFMNNIKLNPSDGICQDHPFLIILVTSYVGHVELRSAHRRAMTPELLRSMNVSRVFLLARIPENEKHIDQESIEDENNTFGDILQGSFLENYRNLTYKHLMGLQWASTICRHATFILKVDDDTVFSIKHTFELLSKENLENTLLGFILNNTKPKREKQNKWFVTWNEYSRNVYPPYLSGWYYITTPKVAKCLCDEAMLQPKFWIDDILITGLLPESINNQSLVKIKLKQLPENYWLEYYELLECCINDMMEKHYICEVVGPNGGRNNLIYEYSEFLRSCENCVERPIDKPLKKSCVINRDRSIFSEGKAEVYHMKL